MTHHTVLQLALEDGRADPINSISEAGLGHLQTFTRGDSLRVRANIDYPARRFIFLVGPDGGTFMNLVLGVIISGEHLDIFHAFQSIE